MSQLKQNVNRHWFAISQIVIFLSVLFVGAQTICYSDEGFFGNAYQYFFTDHQCNYTTDSYYLSIFVGAVWEKVFGWGGILSFNILAALSFCFVFYFVVKILEKYTRYKWYLFSGYLTTILPSSVYLFNNMNLTLMLLSVLSFFLYKFHKKDKISYLFVASFISGVCLFARLPNITLLILPFSVPIYNIIKKQIDLKAAVKESVIIIMGIMFGVLSIIMLMSELGHLDSYYTAVYKNLSVEASGSGESMHSLDLLLYYYIKDYVCVFILCLYFYISYKWIKRYKCLYNPAIVYLITGIVGISILLFIQRRVYVSGYNYFVFSFSLLAIFYTIRENWRNDIFVSLLSTTIAFLLPLGSQAGIGSVGGYSSFIMTPLAFCLIRSGMEKKSHSEYNYYHSFSVFFILLYIIYRFSFTILFGTWAEPGSRLLKTNVITNSKLATTLVSKERFDEIDPALDVLNVYLDEDDYLLCFKDIPIFNYLTHTKPYAYCNDPGFTNPSLFEKHLRKAEIASPYRPVIIREKEINNNPGWERHLAILNSFVSRNSYLSAWENEKFEILIPSNYQKKHNE